jgi:hypothetical protein
MIAAVLEKETLLEGDFEKMFMGRPEQNETLSLPAPSIEQVDPAEPSLPSSS